MAGKHHYRTNWRSHFYNTFLVAALAGASWWGVTSVQDIVTAMDPASAVAAAPLTIAPPPVDQPAPPALPTTEVEVVNAKALGFVTALIRDGVDVDRHEYHMVMVAEAMCSRTEPWGPAEAAVRTLFPHLTGEQAVSFVNATQFYCRALKGDNK